MSQKDFTIDNGTGAAVRVDIQESFQALATNSSGGSAPATNYASQFFANTSTSIMQINNTSGNAFINLFTLAGGPAFPVDGTINSINIGKGTNSLSGNCVFGESALDGASLSGTNNTAIGKSVLDATTSGQTNTGVGMQSLTANTTGSDNNGFGVNSLLVNTTGNSNVAVGRSSLAANTEGSNNVAVGHQALTTNTTAANNVAVGFQALNLNETGTDNVALGANALDANTTASDNTAVGDNALGVNTTGASNTAVGSAALDANLTGNFNQAMGVGALGANTSGLNNVALGHAAIAANQTANNNTGVGYQALTNATGTQNTALGSTAGDLTTTGTNNTSIGFGSDPSSNSASNEVTLGNSSISALRCQVDLTILSDRRDKTNIIDIPTGLDFINILKPRQFEWKTREGVPNKDGTVRAGFIAQELQEAQKGSEYLNLVYESNPEKLEATYGNLIPVLVKAVQELSAKVTALEAG
tara:strand:+ start:6449 stop:7867 length:1419 start_codon:yes stop_codon:yes gene_type:complete